MFYSVLQLQPVRKKEGAHEKTMRLLTVMLSLVLLLAGCSGKTETASDAGSAEESKSESEKRKKNLK